MIPLPCPCIFFVKPRLRTALFPLLFIFAGTVQADNDGPFFGNYAAGKWMIGAKVAKVQAKVFDGNDGLNDGDGTGIILGYEFARPVGYDGKVALEVEILKTNDADIDPASGILSGGVSGAWDADITNVFMSYRSAGTIYFKGKLGFQRNQIQLKIPGATTEIDDAAFAWGVGLGMRLSDWGLVEFEYSTSNQTDDVGLFSANAIATF